MSRQSARHAVALGLVLLSVTVVGAALGGVTAAESQSSPIEISNWTDLNDIRNDTDADYMLVNDLNETTPGYETVAGPNANGGKGFAPIGGFSGSFDGQGNSIANLSIDRLNEDEVGLFGDTSGGAVIEEVTLTSATVTGSEDVGGLVGDNLGTVSNASASGVVNGSGFFVGGLVGSNNEGTVSNSSASGNVTGSSRVGGLVGNNDGTVSNSSASGVVNATGFGIVGGLVGVNEGTVSTSSASGAVNGSRAVGGLVGVNEGTVSTSSASGNVTGTSDVGGLVGGNEETNSEATVSNSEASGVVNGSDDVGGLVGFNFQGAVSNSEASGNVTGSNQVGGLVGFNSEGTVSNSEASGVVNGPDDVGGLVGGNFGGTVSNSSASGVVNGSGFFVGGLVGSNNEGTVSNSSASGAVTGSGAVGGYVGGLVGRTNGGAVSNSSASGNVTGSSRVGGLVGRTNGGAVSNSSASGNVTGSSRVGGLVGENLGTVSTSSASGVVNGSNQVGGLVGENRGTVSNSSASGAVNGSKDVGGLVGLNRGEGTVSTTSASGDVNGFERVGGLVGENRGTVSTSSASGVVNGSGFVGGLVGDNEGTVNNSSASGVVNGSSQVGGLVGSNIEGTVSNSSASGVVNGSGFVGGLVGGNGEGTVSNSSASATVIGSDNVGGLVGYNGNDGTVSTSSASGVVNGSIEVGGLVGSNNEGTVSNSSASGAVTGSGAVGGLVGDNGEGTVSNSSASATVIGSNYVGGLVGYNEGTVSTSSASGTVTSDDVGLSVGSVGGLVGYNEGTVSTSSASGAVTGSIEVGGLVGANSGVSGTVSNSSASGDVTATDESGRAGGLVGLNSLATVSNSSASGVVNGSSNVGGLVGRIVDDGTVSNSSASGAVNATTGSRNVGGLVGYNFEGTVSESFATGAVSGSSDVGGLVGQLGYGGLVRVEEAILRDSYYDNQTTGQQAAVGTIIEGDGTAELRGEVTGLPTSQIQGASAAQNMGGLDFTSTWRVVTNPPGYPELRGLSDGPDTEPPLTAVFTITPENPTVGEQLTLNAGPSTPKSDIQSYDWTLGDGTTATGRQVTHTYTDSGQFTVDLTVQNGTETDTASTGVRVNAPATFEVTLTSVDSAVTAGEIVTASYEVTNTGDLQDTQALDFAVNGTTEDTEAGVTLNGSETVSGQFTYATAGGDVPAVSVAVSSADDSATEMVTVNEPAEFDVTLTSVNSTVTAGETITASYEVTNTGDVAGTQNIGFAVNGTTEDTASGVTLNGSETVSGQFTYDTMAGDAPAVSVTVSSADDSASATVTVNEPPSFDMTITSVDSAVTEGETITLAYEVTNTGDVADTQDITFAVNGTAEDTASGVMLNGSETFNGQFTYDTVTGDAPVASVTVSSANDTATATVTVTEPANFDVNITSVDSEVTQGETITVGYEVTNTGDVAGTQDITFAVNGTPESVESGVTLNGSETVSDQFSYDTVAGDAPAVTVTVSSEDNTASANVTVLAPAVFTVDIVETTTPVEGETLNVTAGIENTGAVEGTQTVTLDVGALGTDSTAVTLGGGGSTTLTLGVGTDTGDAGGYTATVSSANATTSANVTVLTPAQFVVSNLTAPAETTVGASITVSATVTNIGETDGLQAVAFRFDGQTVVNRTVSLAPNASTTLTFTPTVPNQTGTFEHGVFTDDDNETAQITVVEPGPPNVTLSNLRIAGHGDNATVTEGSYNVSVTVSHDGGPDGAIPVELTVGPTTITETITLNTSETTTVTFENATGDLSPGSYDVTVSAGNASITGEVTLSVPVGDNPTPATDTDDDGLLEDVDGDGEFTIFDVQTLFVEFQSDPVQTNSGLFNFDGSGDGAVTIFDVQALFTDLS